jgi:hypothetical protein
MKEERKMNEWQFDHMIEMLEMDIRSTENMESEFAKSLVKATLDGKFFWQHQIENERNKRRMLQRHLDRVKRWKKESGKHGPFQTAL